MVWRVAFFVELKSAIRGVPRCASTPHFRRNQKSNLSEKKFRYCGTRPDTSAITFLFGQSRGVHLRRDACEPLTQRSRCSYVFKEYFPPSQRIALLASMRPIELNANGPLSFILHTITGFHGLSVQHYYGFICHLTPTQILSRLLFCASRFTSSGVDARLPRLLHRALLEIPPSITLLV